ncbi:uncharacterized protein NDAI_0J01140 [Naumovozyma dairenensis CBS 421]|uniref:Uncharacterized protein n=1 Tax=Naumovozyma dairenensis (strain ATCC 10597 / BCRC 20456 / CBS 421 / NBRC 0211 / NRRL Y-12639) TaxID=1071378 RepID=G0WGS8_NAUDC|nr:hypothetical protein NDAI_0J01140 [Naumovozyma dairenensis CBS 421]CCD27006.1 hypothetical protein NDAI_0J01140 [Naumovozyma dairenensis CBS 421]
MKFSIVFPVATLATMASAMQHQRPQGKQPNATTETLSRLTTTMVTITDCENSICSEKTSPALVSTATVTRENTVTEITTWCPISSSSEHMPSPSTTTQANITTIPPATVSSEHVTTPGTRFPSSTHSVSTFTGGAITNALPFAGAVMAGAAALLL